MALVWVPPSGLEYGPETKPSTEIQIHPSTTFVPARCFRQLVYAGTCENACSCRGDDEEVVVIATEMVLVMVVVGAVMVVVRVVMKSSSTTPEHESSTV